MHTFKKLILVVILLGLHTAVMAGQGMFLRIKSYIPNIQVKLLEKNCVNETKNIKLNQTGYIEAGCLNNNWIKIAILQNNKEIMRYKINLHFSGSSIIPSGIKQINNAVIAATLYPHTGILGSQDRVTISIANREDDWMGKNSNAIANKPINSVIIPGSHDTGTFGINKRSQITPDIDPRLKFWINLDPLKIEHLSHWSITQNLDVKNQLNLGIRYLDLRLCNLNKTLITCHSLSGSSLLTIMNHVAEFINANGHQKELVILDINHLYKVNKVDVAQLVSLLRQKFGNKIASGLEFSANSLISDFWNKGKQVIVLIDDVNAVNLYPDIFWSEQKMDSTWPDKQDADELKKALKNILLRNRKRNSFFVLQTQETPSAKTIIDGFNFLNHPDTLLKLTTFYKHEIEKWLQDPIIKSQIKAKGNIIIEDFSNGIDLTEYAKSLNG
jgi:hypothetical protein